MTASDSVWVVRRGRFYERTGGLRDMVPNHLFSLLAMVAIEPPLGFDPESVRNRKAELFAAIPALNARQVVRGQYDKGKVAGKNARAYPDEPGVATGSSTETYVALRVEIDNWRWSGVPFYLRTGKHLTARQTEIAIRFKDAPYTAFQNTRVDAMPANWLVLRIAPREGMAVHYDVKTGDQSQFMRADMVDQAWRIVQPVLEAWAGEKPAFPDYASGSAGPKAAARLIAKDGKRRWRPLTSPKSRKETG
jgi:glucose-6-phosphate 1-dehydrogenase